MTRLWFYCLVTATVLWSGLANLQAAEPVFRVQFLGFGFTNGLDAGLNDYSQIVGRNLANGGFLYDHGTFTQIPSLGSPSSGSPTSINNAGLVGGHANLVTGASHGFLYENGTITDLGSLPNLRNSVVNDLNESGDAVGRSTDGSLVERAVLWRNGSMIDLGVGSANAISESGVIVGTSNNRAVKYENGAVVSLGTFGDSPLTDAIDVNDLGLIVGMGRVRQPSGSFASHPFLYEGGSWRDLGLPEGVPLGIPIDINNRGQIIGNSNGSLGASNRPPFIYTDGEIYNLQSLLDESGAGLNLQLVYGINEHGVILAQGRINNSYQAVLLVPVPEPSSLLLIVLGLVGGLAMRKTWNRR